MSLPQGQQVQLLQAPQIAQAQIAQASLLQTTPITSQAGLIQAGAQPAAAQNALLQATSQSGPQSTIIQTGSQPGTQVAQSAISAQTPPTQLFQQTAKLHHFPIQLQPPQQSAVFSQASPGASQGPQTQLVSPQPQYTQAQQLQQATVLGTATGQQVQPIGQQVQPVGQQVQVVGQQVQTHQSVGGHPVQHSTGGLGHSPAGSLPSPAVQSPPPALHHQSLGTPQCQPLCSPQPLIHTQGQGPSGSPRTSQPPTPLSSPVSQTAPLHHPASLTTPPQTPSRLAPGQGVSPIQVAPSDTTPHTHLTLPVSLPLKQEVTGERASCSELSPPAHITTPPGLASPPTTGGIQPGPIHKPLGLGLTLKQDLSHLPPEPLSPEDMDMPR